MGAPGCVALGPRCHEIGLSNPRFLVIGTPTCITDPNSRSIQLAKSMNDDLERDCRPDPCEQTSADCIG